MIMQLIVVLVEFRFSWINHVIYCTYMCVYVFAYSSSDTLQLPAMNMDIHMRNAYEYACTSRMDLLHAGNIYDIVN